MRLMHPSLQQWHRPANHVLRAGIVLGMTVSLLLPSVAWAFQPEAYDLPSGQPLYQNQPVTVSRQLGRVTQAQAGAGKFVVYVQDLHCNFEVQTNIAKLLDSLAEQHGLSLVAVEGASAWVDVSQLASFPHAWAREDAGQYLLREGRITGAEYYAATGEHPVRLAGIEDPALYQRSREIVAGFLNEESQGMLFDLREALEEIKPAVYSPALLEFDQERNAFREGGLPLLQYAARRLEQWRAARQDAGRVPHTARYVAARQHAWGADVDSDALYDELDVIERSLRERLYDDPAQKQLDRLWDRLDTIERLLNISVTPDELAAVRAEPEAYRTAAFREFMRRYHTEVGYGSEFEDGRLDRYEAQSLEFYRLADRRSRAFVDNTLARMDEQKQTLAVLITGGFHAAQVLDELRRRQVGFAAVKPALHQQDALNPYYALLRDRKTPLDKLLAQNQDILSLETEFPQTHAPGLIVTDLQFAPERVRLLSRLLQVLRPLAEVLETLRHGGRIAGAALNAKTGTVWLQVQGVGAVIRKAGGVLRSLERTVAAATLRYGGRWIALTSQESLSQIDDRLRQETGVSTWTLAWSWVAGPAVAGWNRVRAVWTTAFQLAKQSVIFLASWVNAHPAWALGAALALAAVTGGAAEEWKDAGALRRPWELLLILATNVISMSDYRNPPIFFVGLEEGDEGQRDFLAGLMKRAAARELVFGLENLDRTLSAERDFAEAAELPDVGLIRGLKNPSTEFLHDVLNFMKVALPVKEFNSVVALALLLFQRRMQWMGRPDLRIYLESLALAHPENRIYPVFSRYLRELNDVDYTRGESERDDLDAATRLVQDVGKGAEWKMVLADIVEESIRSINHKWGEDRGLLREWRDLLALTDHEAQAGALERLAFKAYLQGVMHNVRQCAAEAQRSQHPLVLVFHPGTVRAIQTHFGTSLPRGFHVIPDLDPARRAKLERELQKSIPADSARDRLDAPAPKETADPAGSVLSLKRLEAPAVLVVGLDEKNPDHRRLEIDLVKQAMQGRCLFGKEGMSGSPVAHEEVLSVNGLSMVRSLEEPLLQFFHELCLTLVTLDRQGVGRDVEHRVDNLLWMVNHASVFFKPGMPEKIKTIFPARTRELLDRALQQTKEHMIQASRAKQAPPLISMKMVWLEYISSAAARALEELDRMSRSNARDAFDRLKDQGNWKDAQADLDRLREDVRAGIIKQNMQRLRQAAGDLRLPLIFSLFPEHVQRMKSEAEMVRGNDAWRREKKQHEYIVENPGPETVQSLRALLRHSTAVVSGIRDFQEPPIFLFGVDEANASQRTYMRQLLKLAEGRQLLVGLEEVYATNVDFFRYIDQAGLAQGTWVLGLKNPWGGVVESILGLMRQLGSPRKAIPVPVGQAVFRLFENDYLIHQHWQDLMRRPHEPAWDQVNLALDNPDRLEDPQRVARLNASLSGDGAALWRAMEALSGHIVAKVDSIWPGEPALFSEWERRLAYPGNTDNGNAMERLLGNAKARTMVENVKTAIREARERKKPAVLIMPPQVVAALQALLENDFAYAGKINYFANPTPNRMKELQDRLRHVLQRPKPRVSSWKKLSLVVAATLGWASLAQAGVSPGAEQGIPWLGLLPLAVLAAVGVLRVAGDNILSFGEKTTTPIVYVGLDTTNQNQLDFIGDTVWEALRGQWLVGVEGIQRNTRAEREFLEKTNYPPELRTPAPGKPLLVRGLESPLLEFLDEAMQMLRTLDSQPTITPAIRENVSDLAGRFPSINRYLQTQRARYDLAHQRPPRVLLGFEEYFKLIDTADEQERARYVTHDTQDWLDLFTGAIMDTLDELGVPKESTVRKEFEDLKEKGDWKRREAEADQWWSKVRLAVLLSTMRKLYREGIRQRRPVIFVLFQDSASAVSQLFGEFLRRVDPVAANREEHGFFNLDSDATEQLNNTLEAISQQWPARRPLKPTGLAAFLAVLFGWTSLGHAAAGPTMESDALWIGGAFLLAGLGIGLIFHYRRALLDVSERVTSGIQWVLVDPEAWRLFSQIAGFAALVAGLASRMYEASVPSGSIQLFGAALLSSSMLRPALKTVLFGETREWDQAAKRFDGEFYRLSPYVQRLLVDHPSEFWRPAVLAGLLLALLTPTALLPAAVLVLPFEMYRRRYNAMCEAAAYARHQIIEFNRALTPEDVAHRLNESEPLAEWALEYLSSTRAWRNQVGGVRPHRHYGTLEYVRAEEDYRPPVAEPAVGIAWKRAYHWLVLAIGVSMVSLGFVIPTGWLAPAIGVGLVVVGARDVLDLRTRMRAAREVMKQTTMGAFIRPNDRKGWKKMKALGMQPAVSAKAAAATPGVNWPQHHVGGLLVTGVNDEQMLEQAKNLKAAMVTVDDTADEAFLATIRRVLPRTAIWLQINDLGELNKALRLPVDGVHLTWQALDQRQIDVERVRESIGPEPKGYPETVLTEFLEERHHSGKRLLVSAEVRAGDIWEWQNLTQKGMDYLWAVGILDYSALDRLAVWRNRRAMAQSQNRHDAVSSTHADQPPRESSRRGFEKMTVFSALAALVLGGLTYAYPEWSRYPFLLGGSVVTGLYGLSKSMAVLMAETSQVRGRFIAPLRGYEKFVREGNAKTQKSVLDRVSRDRIQVATLAGNLSPFWQYTVAAHILLHRNYDLPEWAAYLFEGPVGLLWWLRDGWSEAAAQAGQEQAKSQQTQAAPEKPAQKPPAKPVPVTPDQMRLNLRDYLRGNPKEDLSDFQAAATAAVRLGWSRENGIAIQKMIREAQALADEVLDQYRLVPYIRMNQVPESETKSLYTLIGLYLMTGSEADGVIQINGVKSALSIVDYYKFLEVNLEAGPKEIKRAYQKAANRYHPDKNPENQKAKEQFIVLGQAHDVLRNDDLRAIYDHAKGYLAKAKNKAANHIAWTDLRTFVVGVPLLAVALMLAWLAKPEYASFFLGGMSLPAVYGLTTFNKYQEWRKAGGNLIPEEEVESNNPFVRAHGLLHQWLDGIPRLAWINRSEFLVHLLDMPLALVLSVQQVLPDSLKNLPMIPAQAAAVFFLLAGLAGLASGPLQSVFPLLAGLLTTLHAWLHGLPLDAKLAAAVLATKKIKNGANTKQKKEFRVFMRNRGQSTAQVEDKPEFELGLIEAEDAILNERARYADRGIVVIKPIGATEQFIEDQLTLRYTRALELLDAMRAQGKYRIPLRDLPRAQDPDLNRAEAFDAVLEGRALVDVRRDALVVDQRLPIQEQIENARNRDADAFMEFFEQPDLLLRLEADDEERAEAGKVLKYELPNVEEAAANIRAGVFSVRLDEGQQTAILRPQGASLKDAIGELRREREASAKKLDQTLPGHFAMVRLEDSRVELPRAVVLEGVVKGLLRWEKRAKGRVTIWAVEMAPEQVGDALKEAREQHLDAVMPDRSQPFEIVGWDRETKVNWVELVAAVRQGFLEPDPDAEERIHFRLRVSAESLDALIQETRERLKDEFLRTVPSTQRHVPLRHAAEGTVPTRLEAATDILSGLLAWERVEGRIVVYPLSIPLENYQTYLELRRRSKERAFRDYLQTQAKKNLPEFVNINLSGDASDEDLVAAVVAEYQGPNLAMEVPDYIRQGWIHRWDVLEVDGKPTLTFEISGDLTELVVTLANQRQEKVKTFKDYALKHEIFRIPVRPDATLRTGKKKAGKKLEKVENFWLNRDEVAFALTKGIIDWQLPSRGSGEAVVAGNSITHPVFMPAAEFRKVIIATRQKNAQAVSELCMRVEHVRKQNPTKPVNLLTAGFLHENAEPILKALIGYGLLTEQEILKGIRTGILSCDVNLPTGTLMLHVSGMAPMQYWKQHGGDTLKPQEPNIRGSQVIGILLAMPILAVLVWVAAWLVPEARTWAAWLGGYGVLAWGAAWGKAFGLRAWQDEAIRAQSLMAALPQSKPLTPAQEVGSRNPFVRAHGLLHQWLEGIPGLRRLNQPHFEWAVHLADAMVLPIAVALIAKDQWSTPGRTSAWKNAGWSTLRTAFHRIVSPREHAYEKPRTAPPTALAKPYRVPRIYTSETRETVRSLFNPDDRILVFNLDNTLGYTEHLPQDALRPYALRPGTETLLRQFNAEGYRLALWTPTREDKVRSQFLEAYPELTGLFDAVITGESYLVPSSKEKQALPELAGFLTMFRGGKAVGYLFGPHAALIEDGFVAVNWGAEQGYKVVQVASFGARSQGDEEFATLAERVHTMLPLAGRVTANHGDGDRGGTGVSQTTTQPEAQESDRHEANEPTTNLQDRSRLTREALDAVRRIPVPAWMLRVPGLRHGLMLMPSLPLLLGHLGRSLDTNRLREVLGRADLSALLLGAYPEFSAELKDLLKHPEQVALGVLDANGPGRLRWLAGQITGGFKRDASGQLTFLLPAYVLRVFDEDNPEHVGRITWRYRLASLVLTLMVKYQSLPATRAALAERGFSTSRVDRNLKPSTTRTTLAPKDWAGVQARDEFFREQADGELSVLSTDLFTLVQETLGQAEAVSGQTFSRARNLVRESLAPRLTKQPRLETITALLNDVDTDDPTLNALRVLARRAQSERTDPVRRQALATGLLAALHGLLTQTGSEAWRQAAAQPVQPVSRVNQITLVDLPLDEALEVLSVIRRALAALEATGPQAAGVRQRLQALEQALSSATGTASTVQPSGAPWAQVLAGALAEPSARPVTLGDDFNVTVRMGQAGVKLTAVVHEGRLVSVPVPVILEAGSVEAGLPWEGLVRQAQNGLLPEGTAVRFYTGRLERPGILRDLAPEGLADSLHAAAGKLPAWAGSLGRLLHERAVRMNPVAAWEFAVAAMPEEAWLTGELRAVDLHSSDPVAVAYREWIRHPRADAQAELAKVPLRMLRAHLEEAEQNTAVADWVALTAFFQALRAVQTVEVAAPERADTGQRWAQTASQGLKGVVVPVALITAGRGRGALGYATTRMEKDGFAVDRQILMLFLRRGLQRFGGSA